MYQKLLEKLAALRGKFGILKKFAPFLWYRNILYSIDLLTNALTLGDPREPISSVLGKLQREGGCKTCTIFCGILSVLFMEMNHCANSIHEHLGRGTTNDMAPIPGFRKRKWGNAFVIILLVMLWYRDDILQFIIKIT